VRQISIPLGQSLFTGKMTLDGKALDTSMTEPGFHFLIHFERGRVIHLRFATLRQDFRQTGQIAE